MPFLLIFLIVCFVGVEDIILPLAGILLGLGAFAVVTSKKNLFKQI